MKRQRHGESKTKLYKAWSAMKQRCESKNPHKYKSYGSKNISVCSEWKHDFLAFKEWAMKNGYDEHLTLDRIDVDGDYCPGNCRWVTFKKQQNNRSTSKWIEHEGEKRTVAEWCEIKGVSQGTAWYRLQKGMTFDEVFNPITDKRKPVLAISTVTGEEMYFDSVSDAERHFGSKSISDALKGKRKTVKKHLFSYADTPKGGGLNVITGSTDF